MSSRRRFISSSLGAVALGGALPGFVREAAWAQTLPLAGASVDPRNVLVVVQLNGGNDGLNTVVPYSDDAYHKARPTIRVAENTVLKIDERVGFNPALAGLHELYKNGQVALIHGVGYPNPNRSHFEATQIWETASPQRPLPTGWLGRYLDGLERGANGTTSFAGITLGDTVPAALLAQHASVQAIGALNTFAYNSGKDAASKSTAGALFDGARPGQSPYLSLIEDTARNALHGGDVLRAKTAAYKTAVTYPGDGFAQQLQLAARIVGSDLGVRIIFVSLGTFDTHAGQRSQQDKLLGYLGNGLLAFYKDLAEHGNASRVLTMTFSEFGRRVTQNASNGTDHGTAAPLFVVGAGIKGGTFGEQPSLTDLDNGDLKFGTDFRAVYATVLERWLGRDAAPIVGEGLGRLAFV
jgi:uncharacterized protein (DUF1501 family)